MTMEPARHYVKDARGNTFQVNDADLKTWQEGTGSRVGGIDSKLMEGYVPALGGQAPRQAAVTQQDGMTTLTPPEPEHPNFGRMKKPELVAFAEQQGINIEGATTKAEIAAKLIEAQGDDDDDEA